MDFELKTLGQTLAIGGFTIFGIFHLISLYRRSWGKKISSLTLGGQRLHQSALILALFFATGILIEDVSKDFSAERSDFPMISWLFNSLVDRDKELRLKSLFIADPNAKGYLEVHIKPVFQDLIDLNDNFNDPYFSKYRKNVEEILNASRRGDNDFQIDNNRMGNFEDAINGIYYAAKNRVSRQDNYSGELHDKGVRIDFLRSIIFVCSIYSILYLSLLISCFATRKSSSVLRNARERWKFVLLLFIVYALGFFLARTAYRAEVTRYNLLVFGNYTSLVANDELQARQKSP